MKIETKYNIRDKIYISDLKISGVVVGFYFGDHGLQYNIRHFKDNKADTNYFYDFEIESFKETEKEVGFKANPV